MNIEDLTQPLATFFLRAWEPKHIRYQEIKWNKMEIFRVNLELRQELTRDFNVGDRRAA